MHFDIFTLFPAMFQGPFSESILKRAQERGLLSIALHDIRDATSDKHHMVDDYPYGGGAGMVMKPEPIFSAIEPVHQGGPIIYLTPQGRLFDQRIARELAHEERITLLCGHYEGIDERVNQHLITDELSIGDYVLTGGELAAMIVVDAVSRLLPGVLTEGSADDESHSNNLLEYPQYTRPPDFRGWHVPDILLSGHHENIARWHRKEAIKRTRQRRPDLFERLDLSSKLDKKLLRELDEEEKASTTYLQEAGMQLTTYQNAHDFLARTQTDLLKNEALNSLMLGICFNLRDHPERIKMAPYLATVSDKEGLLCAALMTPPHRLILYSQRNNSEAALKLLAENLHKQGWTVSGTLGPQQVVQDFVQVWRAVSGQEYRIEIRERVFELTQVQHPAPVEGTLRAATEDELDLLTDWMKAFIAEAHSGDDPMDALRMVQAKIAHGDIYVWELPNGQVVSTAARTRPVISVISIGAVYTPPKHRGKGYASNCVAALSQQLLDSGWRACSLFADLANPTSNAIYEKMGYRPLAEYHAYAFEQPLP